MEWRFRRPRAIGLILFCAVVAAALFGSLVVLKRQTADPPPLSANKPLEDYDWEVFSAEVGRWRIRGRLLERDGTSFRIELRLSDVEGQSAGEEAGPSVFLEMPDGSQSPIKAQVRATEAGVYIVEATAPTRGLWRLSVVLPDDLLHVNLSLN